MAQLRAEAMEHLGECIKLARHVLDNTQSKKDKLYARTYKCRAHIVRDEISEASDVADTLFEADPNSARSLVAMALCHDAKDEPDKASDFFRRAIHAPDAETEDLLNFVRYYDKQDRKDEACALVPDGHLADTGENQVDEDGEGIHVRKSLDLLDGAAIIPAA